MTDQPFQPRRPAEDEVEEKPLPLTRDVIDEALRKQAVNRPERPPAVLIDTIPKVPRQPKPAMLRKQKRRKH